MYIISDVIILCQWVCIFYLLGSGFIAGDLLVREIIAEASESQVQITSWCHIVWITNAGMSESSGPHTVCKMEPDCWNPASVGKDMLGVRTKIFQPDANGEGEVFQSYTYMYVYMYAHTACMYMYPLLSWYVEACFIPHAVHGLICVMQCVYKWWCRCVSLADMCSWATSTTGRKQLKQLMRRAGFILGTLGGLMW